MTNLIGAYITYRQKRAEIKERQRQELERELEPFLKAFGDEIVKAQENGKRIEDIEYDIGAKNRTLVYRAKRLAKRLNTVPGGTDQDEADSLPEAHWELLTVYGGYDAYVDGKLIGTVLIDDDGQIVPPDDWALDTENQGMYRDILREVRNRINN